MLKHTLFAAVAAFAFAQAAFAETPTAAPAAPPAPAAVVAAPVAPVAPVVPAQAAIPPDPARREEEESTARPGIAARLKALMAGNTSTALP